jgi:hypothetical protein
LPAKTVHPSPDPLCSTASQGLICWRPEEAGITNIGRFGVRDDPLFDELHALETEMLNPEVRSNPARLDFLLRSDFVEFGSSGRIHYKSVLVDMLVHEQHAEVIVRDFAVKELSTDAALVTYRTTGTSGHAVRRSSIWTNRDGRWQMLFHQGTPIPHSRRVG